MQSQLTQIDDGIFTVSDLFKSLPVSRAFGFMVMRNYANASLHRSG